MSTNQFRTPMTISTNDTHILKVGQPDGSRPTLRTIDITANTVVGGQIVVSSRAKGSSAAFKAVPYENLHLNAAAGSGALVSTAIIGNSLIRIDDTGLEIALVTTGFGSGSFTVETWVGSEA